MNLVQKAARWAFEKAVGFPTWNTSTWPAGVVLGLNIDTDAGVTVTADTALQASAIWACVRIRALIKGHFPAVVYKRTPDGMLVLHDHDLAPILQDSANEYMTAMEWRQAMSVAFDLYGNAFSEIVRIGGRVVALNPLRSERMAIKFEKELIYEYTQKDGSKKQYAPDDILHIRNFSLDGIVGLNPIQQQRHSVGLAIAQQRYGSALYRNGGRPAGVLEHPAQLKPEAVQRLRESWESIHSGSENAGKVAILWEGMKYNAIGLSPQDSQYIESRKFQLSEIARLYGLPPHMIADLDRSTNNNIEHQGIEVVTYNFRPESVLWEQRIKKSLLNRPGKDSGVYVSFDSSELMRGDLKSQAEALASLKQNGFLSANEGRTFLKRNRVDGPGMDDYTVQSNMIDVAALAKLLKPVAGGNNQ